MVSIVAFQAMDPGSIPGRRTLLFFLLNRKSRFVIVYDLTNLATEISLPNAENIVVNGLRGVVNSFFATFCYLDGTFTCVEDIGGDPLKLLLSGFLWVVIGGQQRSFLFLADYPESDGLTLSETPITDLPFDFFRHYY